MTHPCASHLGACDHCAVCESGVCCAGLSAEQKAQLLALMVDEQQRQRFHQAVAAEAERRFSLAELVQIETERQVLGAPLHEAALLVRALAAPERRSDSRKEGVYVHAACPAR